MAQEVHINGVLKHKTHSRSFLLHSIARHTVNGPRFITCRIHMGPHVDVSEANIFPNMNNSCGTAVINSD